MPLSSVRVVDDQYAKIYAFLCSLERFGILLGLENISLLLEKLGNPHRTFPVIHVGGSNGKGSTASFICAILSAAGLKPALYTSPHLNDFRERIRINGAMVSKEAVVASTRKIQEIYDPERTTFFEFTTAVAFDCLAQAKPDVAVIEVGLGGRLDATNTVNPIVTVITDVSREHEDYLGIGIESVAREKAGIIKPGVPLVTGASRSGARRVIYQVANDARAQVREFGRDFVGIRTGLALFTYKSRNLVIEDLAVGMAGGHQIKNAAMACATAEYLSECGYSVPITAFREGIQKTRFAGRFEIVRQSPQVIIDGAHTPEGMRLLKSTFKRLYPGVRPFLLMGMLKEKDYREMTRILAPMGREVVCVPPQGNRGLDPGELAACARECGVCAIASTSITEGLHLLLEKASKSDIVLAAGSLYMIGPVRRACGVGEE
jgi:dihydrofolate synthase/folylpolyglutamate synthase